MAGKGEKEETKSIFENGDLLRNNSQDRSERRSLRGPRRPSAAWARMKRWTRKGSHCVLSFLHGVMDVLEGTGDDPWRRDLRGTLSFLITDGDSLSDRRMRVFLLSSCQSSL